MKLANAMVPEWIKEIIEDRERRTREYEETARYNALANALAKSEGPELFQQIVKELTLQALACKTIGVLASVSDVSRKNNDGEQIEQAFRVKVSANSPFPRSTYLDFSYAEGDRCIRCYPRDGESFKIDFLPNEHGKLVMQSDHTPLPTAEKAAAYLIKPLVKDVLTK